MRYGIIHSIETCGTVDGPGLRFVVFTQGCLMRCLYCHNRDTWDMETDKSRKVTVDELMQQVIQYRFYLKATGGGVTASGGESLLQPEFIRDWFAACKAYGIHTCLDTNGYARHYDDTLKELLDHTDLVMLDLKQLDNDIHKKLVGVPNTRTLMFAKHLQERNQLTRIRYVIVPGYSVTTRRKAVTPAKRKSASLTPTGRITAATPPSPPSCTTSASLTAPSARHWPPTTPTTAPSVKPSMARLRLPAPTP